MVAQSTIGPTTAIRGNVQGDGDLEILGRVEGSVVMTGDVTIGEGALIQSDVRGRRVVVRGAVAGSIFGEEAVVLEPGARVVGDLGAPQIGIQPGALVRGNVTTGAPRAAAAPAPRAAAVAAAPAAAAPAAPPRAAAPARPARAPAPAARPAPAPRVAPAPPARPAPAARSAPAEARPAPEPRHAPVHEEEEAELSASAAGGEAEEPEAGEGAGGPPPPVVPALRKGAAKASLRKKGGR
ncbi:polymer-forming cytoskeletal protein [Sorangium sp. So ce1036]|uniref:bactofilin family protein n=1 Tax=Sorangium sp. So ce1036 TaxID=3133328 RepID=UPI003F029F53